MPHHPHPITTVVNDAMRRLQSPSHRRRLEQRWNDEPHLGGLGLDDIIARCAIPTTEHNPIVANLIDLHQHGDPDATQVLLYIICPIVTSYSRRSDHPDAISNHWAGAGHVLATYDPTKPPVYSDGTPRPHLHHLADLIRSRARTLDPLARNTYRRHHRGEPRLVIGLPTQPGHNSDDTRIVPMWNLDPGPDPTADAALRRVALSQVRDCVDSGHITQHHLRQLIAHRVTDTRNGSSSTERMAVMRTGRRLAAYVTAA